MTTGTKVRGLTITVERQLVTETCCNCGVLFAMTKEFKQGKLDNRHKHNQRTFYCPNGHAQWYVGETEAQKLKRELEQAQRAKEWYEGRYRSAEQRATHERNRANGYKGHATRLTKRVKAGVCICCNRTFKDLARHMATKHPTLTPQDSVEEPAFMLAGGSHG